MLLWRQLLFWVCVQLTHTHLWKKKEIVLVCEKKIKKKTIKTFITEQLSAETRPKESQWHFSARFVGIRHIEWWKDAGREVGRRGTECRKISFLFSLKNGNDQRRRTGEKNERESQSEERGILQKLSIWRLADPREWRSTTSLWRNDSRDVTFAFVYVLSLICYIHGQPLLS